MHQKSPIPRIMAQLRDVLRSTRYTMMADVEPLVEQTYILLGFENPDDPRTRIYVSDFAYNLSIMLEHTRDNSIIRLCLGVLLRLGGIGDVLAGAYLRKNKLPRETLIGTLNAMAPTHKLALANSFFRHPAKHDPWFLQWAHEVARGIQGDDPEEALLFLEGLADSEIGLANPMQRELLRGRFGVWLQRLLHLDLNDEQLAFMTRASRCLASHFVALSLVRTLDKQRGERLAEVLECVGVCGRKQDPTLEAKVLPYVRHEEERVAVAALRALAALRTEKLPQALAYVYVQRPAFKDALLPLLLRMNATGLRIFLARLPHVERLELAPRLAALIATFCPVWMLDALRRKEEEGREHGEGWKRLVQAMEDFLLAHPPLSRDAAYKPAPAGGPKKVETRVPGSEQERSAFALFERMKRGVSRRQAGDFAPAKAEELRLMLQKGGLMERVSLEGHDLPALEVKNASLLRCTMGVVGFSRCALRSVRFEKCTLRNVDMDGALLREVSFIECDLFNCRFVSSRMEHVLFQDCVVRGGQFSDSVLHEARFTGCKLSECDFSGSLLTGFEAWRCWIYAGHFAHVTAQEPVIQGVEFVDCRFFGCGLDGGTIRNSAASTSTFAACSFYGLDTDEPGFLIQERKTAVTRMAAAAPDLKSAPRAPQLGSAAGMKIMTQLVEQWFFEKDLKEREAYFLSNNRRRQDWALCMLPEPADVFFRILPAVLESAGPLPGHAAPEPVCAIHGYVPDLSIRQLLATYAIAPGPEAGERDTAVPIEGLYTIGSTGTIAQARSSDIDVWVCYAPHEVDPESAGALQAKLGRIEEWAWSAFGVEVHFFLMDLHSVRDNEFGFTDKESAGSSQAQLLKEEFYRTGVYLAGKKPVWWYLPVDVDAAGYRRALQRFHRAVGPLDRSILDLGHLAEIPKEEFFGASLWQIVKAIDSPFKSVMKLALLDKYTHGGDLDVLLCNRVKRNVFLGARDLWDIDPYAMMFREVFEYYARVENKEAQDLMRVAFLQKTGLYLAAQGSGRFYELQDYSFMEYFFPYSEAAIASHVEPGRSGPAQEIAVADNFAGVVELGRNMVRFMLKTYETIHAMWSAKDLEIRVTEEDMTILGRKVFSYLHPRPHKVMRLPFIHAGRHYFSSLEVSCEGAPGTPATWVVTGEPPKRDGRRADKEVVRRSRSLEDMLVWLVVNGVYAPHMPVLGSNIRYPFALDDLTELLRTLYSFFPVGEIFDSPVEEYLRPEAVTRALALLNWGVAREERRIKTAVVVYATNWGELFCAPAPREHAVLRDHPREFLRANVDKQLHRDVRLMLHLPPKSLCPPVKLYDGY